MHCVKKVTDDLYWIGGSDRRLALFENVYPIPRGVSYNSYSFLISKQLRPVRRSLTICTVTDTKLLKVRV